MARLTDGERLPVCVVARRAREGFEDDATYEETIIALALLEWLTKKDRHRGQLALRIATRFGGKGRV